MKKILFSSLIFSPLLFGADISSLPSSITLTTGEQRQDTALSQQGNRQATLFHTANSPANFTLSGAGSYILNVGDDTTTFHIGYFSVGANSQLALTSFHTVAFNGGLTLGENAVFSNIASGNTINAQGSEYGGESKVIFANRNAQITLGANSSATFSNGFIFASNAIITLSANSTLNIDATKAIRFQNDFTNNGGTANLTGNVYNVGGTVGISNDTSTSTFTLNSGSVTIDGNFYNGIESNDMVVDTTGGAIFNTFDPAFGGGGNLVINGGTMTITGTLISQVGGISIRDGGISKPQNSSIKIYGGTLEVGSGLYNKEGSTLTFGIGNNGQMGKLQGNLINENGQVVVDTKGVSVGQSYQIITGSATGLDDAHFSIINNPNSQFYEIIYQNGSVSVKQASSGGGSGGGSSGGGTNPPAPSKIEVFKNSLNSNERSIFNALSAKFGGDDEFLLNSEVEAQNAITTTEQVIKDSYIAQPQTMINALQSGAMPLPVPKRVAVSRRIAATEIIRFDNGKRVSPFEKKIVRAPKNRNFYFTPLGAILRADKLTGYIAGFTLGTNYEGKNYSSQIYVAYAYGASSQDFDTQSTDTTGNLFQAGFLNRYSYSVFEVATNANLLAGVFRVKNEWAQNAALNSTANFGDYQLNLGVILGAKLGEKLSFKPFAGIQNYFEFKEGFKQDGGLQLETKGYNAYIIDGVLGVEGRYTFSEIASVYGKFGFEERLYNTHKTMLMWAFDNELTYDNKSYDNALSLSFGTQIFTWYDFNFDAEISYKHYNNGLNYFGGNFIFKYAF